MLLIPTLVKHNGRLMGLYQTVLKVKVKPDILQAHSILTAKKFMHTTCSFIKFFLIPFSKVDNIKSWWILHAKNVKEWTSLNIKWRDHLKYHFNHMLHTT